MNRAAAALILGAAVMWASPALASSDVNWAPAAEMTLPANAAANPNVFLNSISCRSAANCTAVGDYKDSAGHTQGLMVTETAGTWSAGVEAHLPAGAASSPDVDLEQVSCGSVGNCVAAGSYTDSSGHSQGLLLTQSGGVWSAGIQPPLPAFIDPGTYLWAVSCPSAGNCTAAGQYTDINGHLEGLLVSESGGSWSTGTSAPLGVTASDPAAGVFRISCSSAGDCTATGYFNDLSSHKQLLLLRETGGSWSSVESPLPANAGSIPDPFLYSISCPAAGRCAIGGSYNDSTGHSRALIVTESGTSWSAAELPLPANAFSVPAAYIRSVSCVSVGDCTAVGSYNDVAGNQGLLLTESAGVWSADEAVLPSDAGASPGVALTSVSCWSQGSCGAIGFYRDGSGHYQGILVTESAGHWDPGVEWQRPANAGPQPGAFLWAVSCPAPGSCTGVGEYFDTSSAKQGLLLTAAPANPALSVSAPATATTAATLRPTAVAATLSSGVAPAGEITFKVFGPQPAPPTDCSSGGATVGTAAVSGNGGYNASSGYTPASSGDYWWYASYGGDTGDNPAASTCGSAMPETVVTSSSSLLLSAPAAGTAGTPITAASVAATLTSGPGAAGTITFRVFGPQPSPPASCAAGGTTVGTATVAGSGTYNPSAGFTPHAAGDYWWYAGYGGDTADDPTGSICGTGMAETTVAPPTASGGADGTATIGRIKVAGAVARVSIGCRGDAGAHCVVALTLTATETVRGRRVVAVHAAGDRRRGHLPTTRRRVTMSKATLTLGGGRGTTVALALDPAARRLLSRFHRLGVRLTVSQGARMIAGRTIAFHVRRHHRRG